MLNLRRQNQRFEMLIQNAVHGVLFMLTFFVLEKELISWTCTAHALATLTQEGRSNWGARFLRSFEFRLLFVSELFMHVSTARELELESIIAHCAIFARAGPGRTHFQVNRKGVYMTSFKRDYMWVAFMLPQNQRFALITFRNAPFCAFWNGVYKKMSPDATVFCTNHVWKRWFWPQKVEHKRTLRGAPIAVWLRPWTTVYAIYFAGVLFSRISRVGAFREFNNMWK